MKNGGKVITKKLKGNRFMKICYDKQGNSHAGEIKTKKSSKANNKSRSKRNFQKKIDNSKKLAESLLALKEHFHTNYRND